MIAIWNTYCDGLDCEVFVVVRAMAVFKFWDPGPFFICGALRVNVENSWGPGGCCLRGGGGEALKYFRF